jgi:hypothetical protein
MTQFTVQNDWKCALTNSILVVIAVVILKKVVLEVNSSKSASSMGSSGESHWYTSDDFLIFVGAFVAFKVNEMVFGSCNL